MPHIRIQHFAPALSDEALRHLTRAITLTVRDITGCVDEAISIAVEPVAPADWTAKVYDPVIAADPQHLVKVPGYGRLAEQAA